MSGQALYLKYRPRVFDDMIGQAHITTSLRNALAQNRIRHAYLFSGPRGTGKTTMARILAKAVNCQYPDVMLRPCDQCEACVAVNEGRYLDLIEIDAASNNGVDDVRELREKIGFSPNEGRYKVYVIDEVHRFSNAAFDALLKTLEEPPEHAIFVLATTEMDKVPATVKSRCLKYEFKRVRSDEVANRLQAITELEGLSADREALELVARQGTGSVRDSISLLDQLLSDPHERLTRETAERILGTAGNRAVGTLVQALLDNEVATGLDTLNQAIEEGADPRQFGMQIIEYLRNVMLVQTGGAELVDASEEQIGVWQAQAESIKRGALVRAVRSFNAALGEMRASWQPQLPLELALIESTRPITEEAHVPATVQPAPVKNKVAPAATPRTSETEAAPNAPKPVVTLAQIKDHWPDIIAKVRNGDNASLVSLLKEAEPRSLDIETELFTLSMRFATQVDKMNKVENRKTLSYALKDIVGRGFKINAVLAQDAGKSADDTPVSDDVGNFVQDTGGVHNSKKSK